MGCTENGGVYRPRRPRESPLWRLTEQHLETFKQVYDDRFAQRYGFWRAEIERTLLAFLDCGDFEQGFARIRCDACRREFLVALSCKTRGFCPSCNAKRSVLWAEWLTEKVLDRLYGAYPNRTRAARARVLGERHGRETLDHDAEARSLTPSQRERRRHWARLIAKVFELDPLR